MTIVNKKENTKWHLQNWNNISHFGLSFYFLFLYSVIDYLRIEFHSFNEKKKLCFLHIFDSIWLLVILFIISVVCHFALSASVGKSCFIFMLITIGMCDESKLHRLLLLHIVIFKIWCKVYFSACGGKQRHKQWNLLLFNFNEKQKCFIFFKEKIYWVQLAASRRE